MGHVFFKKVVSAVTLVAFVLLSVMPSVSAQTLSQAMSLPEPGRMLGLSSMVEPPVLKGIKVYANDPMRFDFILDQGNGPVGAIHESPVQDIAARLIRYFMASLTVPEGDLWVNLSPYEKDRIIPDAFGQTEMGRDLLAQDYLLKQLTASVIYPESETGKKFWAEVYRQAFEKCGTTDIPVDTFNKVWIVPEKAVVYEKATIGAGFQPARNGSTSVGAIHESSGGKASSVAYVVDAKLKVMLEQDYLAVSRGGSQTRPEKQDIAKEVLRSVIIPIIEKEVNTGANFAQLRQVYYSLILAAWYKRKIKDSLLNAVYVDQKKVAGINIDDPGMSEKIWAQYVEAFKKGAYNVINEDKDPNTGAIIPRKYFSGGVLLAPDKAMTCIRSIGSMPNEGALAFISMRLDAAMNVLPPRGGGLAVADQMVILDQLGLGVALKKGAITDPKLWAWLKITIGSLLEQPGLGVGSKKLTDAGLVALVKALENWIEKGKDLRGKGVAQSILILNASYEQMADENNKREVIRLLYKLSDHMGTADRLITSARLSMSTGAEMDFELKENRLIVLLFKMLVIRKLKKASQRGSEAATYVLGYLTAKQAPFLSPDLPAIEFAAVKGSIVATKYFMDNLNRIAPQSSRARAIIGAEGSINKIRRRIMYLREYLERERPYDLRRYIRMHDRLDHVLMQMAGQETKKKPLKTLLEEIYDPTKLDMLWPLFWKKELREELVRNRIAHNAGKLVPGKPLVVVVYPKFDDNGAFIMDGGSISFIDTNKFNVLYYEAGSTEEMIWALKDATKNAQASTVLIGAHGQSYSMELGYTLLTRNRIEKAGLDWVDTSRQLRARGWVEEIRPSGDVLIPMSREAFVMYDLPSEFRKKLEDIYFFKGSHLMLEDEQMLLEAGLKGIIKPGGTGVLASCWTGLGGANGNNVANMLSRVLNARFLAPQAETSIEDIVFEGEFVSRVTYYDGTTYDTSVRSGEGADKKPDPAMLKRIPGGIDLNPIDGMLHTGVSNGAAAMKFNIDSTMFQQLQNAPGLVPVIINILPMRDLKAFLGL